MNFEIKRTKEKEAKTYKSLYIKQTLADEIAKENKTSWNNVVISMIESCLNNKWEVSK